jgi:hypothetical protein
MRLALRSTIHDPRSTIHDLQSLFILRVHSRFKFSPPNHQSLFPSAKSYARSAPRRFDFVLPFHKQ